MFERETNIDSMLALSDKYRFLGTVGDQDWLTLLGSVKL